MRIVVTAGNTLVPIDRVRAITNVFTGRTGAAIAREGLRRGHDVTLLTSHPDTADELPTVLRYQTFDELESLMRSNIGGNYPEAVVHCAAVSDYRVASVHHGRDMTVYPVPLDLTGKLKSEADELWLRLVKTPKLIDMIRGELAFKGVLVKFKLEVDVTFTQLIETAEASRRKSGADIMVANNYVDQVADAYMGPSGGLYFKHTREELPAQLIQAIEFCAETPNG